MYSCQSKGVHLIGIRTTKTILVCHNTRKIFSAVCSDFNNHCLTGCRKCGVVCLKRVLGYLQGCKELHSSSCLIRTRLTLQNTTENPFIQESRPYGSISQERDFFKELQFNH